MSSDPGEVGSDPTQEVAVSPHRGEVGSEPAQEVVTTANIEEGKEEEEEEDHDTHFKQKCRSPPLIVSPQKKRKQTIKPSSRRRGTQQIKEAKAPAVHAPPPADPAAAHVPSPGALVILRLHQ